MSYFYENHLSKQVSLYSETSFFVILYYIAKINITNCYSCKTINNDSA